MTLVKKVMWSEMDWRVGSRMAVKVLRVTFRGEGVFGLRREREGFRCDTLSSESDVDVELSAGRLSG